MEISDLVSAEAAPASEEEARLLEECQRLLTTKPARLTDVTLLVQRVHQRNPELARRVWQKVCQRAKAEGKLFSFFQEMHQLGGITPIAKAQLWQVEAAVNLLTTRQVTLLLDDGVAMRSIATLFAAAVLSQRGDEFIIPEVIKGAFYDHQFDNADSARFIIQSAVRLRCEQSSVWSDILQHAPKFLIGDMRDLCDRLSPEDPEASRTLLATHLPTNKAIPAHLLADAIRDITAAVGRAELAERKSEDRSQKSEVGE